MLPRGGGAETQGCHLDMQLAGKVVLSAAALLLATAAYKLYKSRPAQAPPGGGNAKAEAKEEAEGFRQPAIQEAVSGAPQWGLRRRRGSKGAGTSLGCSWENPEGSGVLATGASPADSEARATGKPERKRAGEEPGGQCPDSGLAPPRGRGQEAGTAVGGKLPRCPHWCSEPQSSLTGLTAVDGSGVSGELAPWQDSRSQEQLGAGEQESADRCRAAHTERKSDMNKSWVFTRVTGVHRPEAGALQAASDMGLALRQQEGATEASYTFLSVARVRVEENFIPEKMEGTRPRLKRKVYDYCVESTCQATSRGRLAPRTAALVEAPPPVSGPGPLGVGAASGGQADNRVGGVGTAAAPQPVLSPSAQGFSRKQSLLQIVENPELQLQLDDSGDPAASCPDQSALPTSPISQGSLASSSAGSSGKPHLHFVAGANFFHLPLTPGSAPEVRLDLGNCYEVLAFAKKQSLEALKEAAYKVMSDNYLQVLRSPDIYGCLSGAERELILQRRLRGRKHLVVADMCPQEDFSRLCCYDDERDVWHPLARLPPEAVSRGCAVCSLFNYLFIVSGCQGFGHQPSNRVFCYNPLTGIWSEVCPLNQARPHCRLVALDGHLYAIGGECLNTVECYDPRLDRWTFAPPLPSDTFALAHTAAACAGEIFVTGGSLRYLLLRFSAQEQRWRAGPTGGGKDRTAQMVAVKGFLYRFDLNRSLGISVYRCSASTRLWYECATYRTPYPDTFQCAVVDDLIYCVGRQRTLRFLADYVSPRFVPEELQSFPSPQGTLLPTVLTLPGPDVPQTRV
ncbi:kelch domain-containing protein 7A [Mesoplodon densirostris]|uniref:kelch domain-containing protein 7A n=1 Tax=Mesoplodon densirostris TaxID=48708 RepID=UPI0028DB0A19|nr:kelch domain-containing protein 7A [Mesoplodon densirostris]